MTDLEVFYSVAAVLGLTTDEQAVILGHNYGEHPAGPLPRLGLETIRIAMAVIRLQPDAGSRSRGLREECPSGSPGKLAIEVIMSQDAPLSTPTRAQVS